LTTRKPFCASASQTARAIVQVASRVPRRAKRDTALSVSADHIAGLRGGLKPSRKMLSASKRWARSIGCTSPMHSVSSTCPSSSQSRWKPGSRPCHCAASCAASGSNSG